MAAYNLQVSIDSDAGFCFGVVYAIDMAEQILEEDGYLYCLGDIVHNDEEVRRLTAKGLRIIGIEDLPSVKNEKVLIRAHGEAPDTYRIALENNISLIDASCPVVLKLQNRIKSSFDKDEQILIYGKHGHAEVIGLQGQTQGRAIVFQDINELKDKKLPRKITLYSQTTKDAHKFQDVIENLETLGFEVQANDTICRQVSNRDRDLKIFAKLFDKIVFVSGKKSSNGKVLYEVCLKENPHTLFVSNAEEVNKDYFSANERIGICGATSTPMWLMEKVRDKLLSF